MDERQPRGPTQASGEDLKDLKIALIMFGGPVITYRAFRQSGQRRLRGIAVTDFNNAIEALEQSALGRVRQVNVRRAKGPVTVFVKNYPGNVPWPNDLCTETDYRARYHLQASKSISAAVRRALIEAEFVPQGTFPDPEWTVNHFHADTLAGSRKIPQLAQETFMIQSKFQSASVVFSGEKIGASCCWSHSTIADGFSTRRKSLCLTTHATEVNVATSVWELTW